MSPIPSKVREQVAARSHGICEARISSNFPSPSRCDGRASVVHHRQRRGIGSDPHALSNLLHLCGPCHNLIHREPEWSREQGYIVSSYVDEFRDDVNRTMGGIIPAGVKAHLGGDGGEVVVPTHRSES